VLYDPAHFDTLADERWDEARVHDAIAAIVADADAAYDPDALWPAHEWDGWNAALPLKNLYVGAAGVVLALDRLRPHAESTLDLRDVALRALELWRAEPDFMQDLVLPDPAEAGFFLGETGILLAAHRVGADVADELEARVRSNLANEAEELFWGTPGTLLAAALAGLDDAARESADALVARRDADRVWVQRLYGNPPVRSLGAPHGLAGNVRALLHVEHERNDALERETARVLAGQAIVEDGLATWPLRFGGGLAGSDGEVRLQWCGGAPGMLVAAGDYLDEDLVVSGGELVWHAGPHGDEKGHGICHGTAGNGFALLKVFARTGDELWLERARRFATHALAQVERMPARYSLFTGGAGTAIFAAACLDGDARYPLLDDVGSRP
jgi:Lanthionine synthetase C-like protein